MLRSEVKIPKDPFMYGLSTYILADFYGKCR